MLSESCEGGSASTAGDNCRDILLLQLLRLVNHFLSGSFHFSGVCLGNGTSLFDMIGMNV